MRLFLTSFNRSALRNYALLILLVSSSDSIITKQSAITFLLGDRFGDNLASYCHARWIAYVHKIPLLYKSFPYSDKLKLSKIHEEYSDQKFAKRVHLPYKGKKINALELDIEKDANILYILPYFPETHYDAVEYGLQYFDVDWEDQQFLTLLRQEICPIAPLPTLKLPKDRITVALHVRKGSGPDRSFFKPYERGSMYFVENYPLRFPPDTYYIEQIKKISEMFKKKNLYIHLFTDDKNPSLLVEKYKNKLNLPNIEFGITESTNKDSQSAVLEDFFNMTSFDCIIRPESHFSQMASKISRAKVVIRPVDFVWNNCELSITAVEIKVSKNANKRLKKKAEPFNGEIIIKEGLPEFCRTMKNRNRKSHY